MTKSTHQKELDKKAKEEREKKIAEDKKLLDALEPTDKKEVQRLMKEHGASAERCIHLRKVRANQEEADAVYQAFLKEFSMLGFCLRPSLEQSRTKIEAKIGLDMLSFDEYKTMENFYKSKEEKNDTNTDDKKKTT